MSNEQLDEFIERVYFLEFDEGKLFDEGSEFLLLSQEGTILEVADKFVIIIFLLVAGDLKSIALPTVFKHLNIICII